MGPRTGRPPELPDRRRLIAYVTGSELKAIARAAKRANVSTSAWVRTVVLAALRDRTGRTT